MIDENEIIQISNKTVTLGNIGKIVRGEANASLLTFSINKMCDGIDLSTKDIAIYYQKTQDPIDPVYKEHAINIETTGTSLRFSWKISAFAASTSGTLYCMISFDGIEENETYSYKTLTFTVEVENTIRTEEDSDLPDSATQLINDIKDLKYQLEKDLEDGTFNGDGITSIDSTINDNGELILTYNIGKVE